jgi:hypothetical protein
LSDNSVDKLYAQDFDGETLLGTAAPGWASFINSDKTVFLEGANKRFYKEHGYNDGLQLLYTLPYHPVISGSFLKLVQEVTALPMQITPAPNLARTKAAIHAKYIESLFTELNIAQYYEDLLLAYITGVIAHELVWVKDSAGKPKLSKLIAIPPEYFWPTSSGLEFRKSVSGHDLVQQSPNKYSKFAYSHFMALSPLGDGVGKVLYYLLQERANLDCMAKTFALRGATPTVVLSADATVKTSTVRNTINQLNKNEAWKNIALPPGLKLDSITNTAKYDIYALLLKQNTGLIVEQLAGEAIVGSDAATGVKGAQEASNLRKTRAIKLALQAVAHINKHIVIPCINYKFGAQNQYPEFKYLLPKLTKIGTASIQDAISVQAQLGYEINPLWFEEEYSLDIISVGADVK